MYTGTREFHITPYNVQVGCCQEVLWVEREGSNLHS